MTAVVTGDRMTRAIPFVWSEYVYPELIEKRWQHIGTRLVSELVPFTHNKYKSVLIPAILCDEERDASHNRPAILVLYVLLNCKDVKPRHISQGVQHVADILMGSYGYPSFFVARKRPLSVSPTVDALLFDVCYEKYIV